MNTIPKNNLVQTESTPDHRVGYLRLHSYFYPKINFFYMYPCPFNTVGMMNSCNLAVVILWPSSIKKSQKSSKICKTLTKIRLSVDNTFHTSKWVGLT